MPDDNLILSVQGLPYWFSPKHAGEKFKELCIELATLAAEADRAKKKTLAEKLWAVQETGEKYARYYFCDCPVQSVRIMQPSGAIYVVLADGREVVVPQPAREPKS